MLYKIYRACEEVDPRRVYDRGFFKLKVGEQLHFLAYTELRAEEQAEAKK